MLQELHEEPAAAFWCHYVVRVEPTFDNVESLFECLWIAWLNESYVSECLESAQDDFEKHSDLGVIFAFHASDTNLNQKLLVACEQRCALTWYHLESETQSLENEVW